MSQTATQDEDILIISDDTAGSDSDIFLEESVDTPLQSEGENPIKLSLWVQKESVQETEQTKDIMITDEHDSQSSEVHMDLGAFASEIETPASVPESSEVQVSFDTPIEEEPEISSNEFDFSNLSETPVIPATPEVTEEVSEVEQVSPLPEISLAQAVEEVSTDESNLNDILAGTIAKLVKRQEVIASDKTAKTSQIADLKAQIKALEEEVSLHEAEVEVLDVEDDKIGKNITQLEKMKLGDEEVTREHNAKRVAKK